MEEIVIEIKNITKRYSKLIAVDDVSFSIKDKECFALLGSNGAGKTTLINILTTGMLPTSGTATINNYDLIREKEKIRKIINISPQGAERDLGENISTLVKNAKYGDRNLENACRRLRNKSSFFNYCFVYDDQVAPTITAHCNNIRWNDKRYLSKEDIIAISTFPQDFNFLSENLDNIAYVCGMSVPPVMIKRVAERLTPYLKSEV